MRTVARSLSLTHSHTMAVGVNQSQLDLDFLGSNQAIILIWGRIALDSASAVPSITGAGLTQFEFALTRTAQTSPADLASLDGVLWYNGQSNGSTAAGALTASFNFPVDGYIDGVENMPCRELYLFGNTSNITNAATTDMLLIIRYDIVQLTTSELVSLL